VEVISNRSLLVEVMLNRIPENDGYWSSSEATTSPANRQLIVIMLFKCTSRPLPHINWNCDKNL
jgi:hypothetical protein